MMTYTGRFFGLFRLTFSNVGTVDGVFLGILSMLSSIFMGSLILWGGSHLLANYVTAFDFPAFGILESIVTFGVLSLIAGIFRAASDV